MKPAHISRPRKTHPQERPVPPSLAQDVKTMNIKMLAERHGADPGTVRKWLNKTGLRAGIDCRVCGVRPAECFPRGSSGGTNSLCNADHRNTYKVMSRHDQTEVLLSSLLPKHKNWYIHENYRTSDRLIKRLRLEWSVPEPDTGEKEVRAALKVAPDLMGATPDEVLAEYREAV